MSGWIRSGTGWALLLCLVVIALGVSCSRGQDPRIAEPSAALPEYLTRLARVVEADASAAAPEALPPYPERRALLLAVAETDIDVGEFIDVHRCDMGELVGYRNSPLGRVQMASQRLGYEAAWLAAIRNCEQPPDWMRAMAREKAAQLPELFWNATFAAAEMRVALGSAGAPASADLAYLLRALGDALAGLEQGRFEQQRFEKTLGQLRSGSWGGPARARWAGWREALEAAAGLLDGARPGVCLNGRPTPRSGYLVNVFERFYVDSVQPELALMMGQEEVWVRELARLLERLDALPPEAFRSWYRAALDPFEPSSEWARTRRAVVHHAEAWQRMLASCGIAPGDRLGEH